MRIKSMANVDKILKDALREVRPDPNEKKEMKSAMDHIVKTSQIIAKKFNATPMICGSSVKNTWLSGRNEFDLFILFPPALSKAKLKEYYDKFINPYNAASRQDIDDVIEPTATRVAIIQSLEVLSNKAESRPWKKHGNIPL